MADESGDHEGGDVGAYAEGATEGAGAEVDAGLDELDVPEDFYSKYREKRLAEFKQKYVTACGGAAGVAWSWGNAGGRNRTYRAVFLLVLLLLLLLVQLVLVLLLLLLLWLDEWRAVAVPGEGGDDAISRPR